ncbi:MAG TPA: cytochrome c3 family protein [Anaerolineae bacterium]
MPQVFHRSANTIARASIVGAAVLVGGLLIFLGWFVRSDYFRGVGAPVTQPVPFSHEHHVAGLGIDCRYCHTTVETSSFAGLPPTQTCMNCHSQIWNTASLLQPVRDSFKSGQPIVWNRVYNLPGFVYFNHSIHVQKGIGCETCHGRVDQMPLTAQATSLQMGWCLDCHNAPQKYIRPKDQVFTMGYRPSGNQLVLGDQLVKDYHVKSLTSCSTCHR